MGIGELKRTQHSHQHKKHTHLFSVVQCWFANGYSERQMVCTKVALKSFRATQLETEMARKTLTSPAADA